MEPRFAIDDDDDDDDSLEMIRKKLCFAEITLELTKKNLIKWTFDGVRSHCVGYFSSFEIRKTHRKEKEPQFFLIKSGI